LEAKAPEVVIEFWESAFLGRLLAIADIIGINKLDIIVEDSLIASAITINLLFFLLDEFSWGLFEVFGNLLYWSRVVGVSPDFLLISQVRPLGYSLSQFRDLVLLVLNHYLLNDLLWRLVFKGELILGVKVCLFRVRVAS
jgi:hypothetical protein